MPNPIALPASRTSAVHDALAMSLAQSLAQELASGKVELPGFPNVAVQVQRVLADEDVTPLRVVRVIGAEPVLAGRVLQCANSVIFNPGAVAVSGLRAAVARVGLDFVRTLTISFAVNQLKSAPTLRAIAPQLDALWLRSVSVSTLCFIIARRFARASADAAFLAGLLHGIGALYIQTRALNHPELRARPESYALIERTWEAHIARALLESWKVSDDIVDAVGALYRVERATAGPAGLREVLRAGVLITGLQSSPHELQLALASSHACAQLGLTPAVHESLVRESAAEVAALRSVLGC